MGSYSIIISPCYFTMQKSIKSPTSTYHVESLLASNPCGDVYRVFTRRRSGRGLRRHYYALVSKGASNNTDDLQTVLNGSRLPFPVYVRDNFSADGKNYVVIAKGKAPRKVNPVWQAVQNKGYLMILLAALILILLIIRYFRSPV